MAADAQLLGRVTYEGFAKAWPTMEAGEFGVKMNAMPKYVVSSTLERAEWNNTTVLRGDLEDEVARLKQRYTGDILVVGSGRLARDLLAKGLVDELHLMVFPVVLGAGQKLFGESPAETGMELVETRQAASVAILTLRPRPSG
ncbi:MAG: dihydrofolate reductase family protein [Gaiellales bacterium]